MFCIVDLKSNMDRFIENQKALYKQQEHYLKSNMDRFIGYPQTQP